MTNISGIFEVPLVEGFKVGIEIETEIETPEFVDLVVPEGCNWRLTGDGSLRGNGVEWVMRKPTDQWYDDLADVDDIFEELEVSNVTSPRCGVHVHVNVSDLSVEEMWRVVGMSIVMENVFLAYSGEKREHNLFCLGSEDAEGGLQDKRSVYIKTGMAGMADRYAAINLASLALYGTVEYRCMRTPSHMMDIDYWVRILKSCYCAALEYDHVKDIPMAVSVGGGGEEFVKTVLGPELFREVADKLGDYDYDYSIMRGVRNLQDVIR